MNSRYRWLSILSIVALAIAPVGCGSDDDGGTNPGDGGGGDGFNGDLDLPQEWWGVWEEVGTYTDCSVAPPTTEPETEEIQFCPENEVFDDFEGISVLGSDLEDICTSTINGTQVRIICDGTITPSPLLPTCTVDFDVDLTVDRTSDTTYDYTYDFMITPSAGCDVGGESLDPFCETSSGTGTRISTSTDGCDDNGGGGGGEDNTVTLGFTGGSGPSSVEFTSGASFVSGVGYTISGTGTAGGGSNFQQVLIGVPESATTGVAVNLVAASQIPGLNDASISYTELRDGVSWFFSEFDGSITLTAMSASNVAGTIAGTATNVRADSEGSVTESIAVSGSFDVDLVGDFAQRDAVRNAVRDIMHRAMVNR